MSQAQPAAEPWRQNLRGEHDALLHGPRASWWWTGLPPERCPGRQPDGTLTALPAPNLANCTRQSVQAAFDNGWTLTELLFASLQGEEAFYRPPYHHLRHPMIFYYCHPAALYINKLRVAGLIDAPLNPWERAIPSPAWLMHSDRVGYEMLGRLWQWLKGTSGEPGQE